MSFFSCIFAVENKINMGDENSIFRTGKPIVYGPARIGIKVYITYPVEMTYNIETKDEFLAVSKAFNMARHDFSNIDWSRGKFKIGHYMYIDDKRKLFI